MEVRVSRVRLVYQEPGIKQASNQMRFKPRRDDGYKDRRPDSNMHDSTSARQMDRRMAAAEQNGKHDENDDENDGSGSMETVPAEKTMLCTPV